ncbi:MAG: 4Fe-4S dicluster domain-containing protein, partial [Kovacikia sp.]
MNTQNTQNDTSSAVSSQEPAVASQRIQESIPSPPFPTPSFDLHSPPDPKIIDTCVHCGFCLSTCPSYRVIGKEMDSPRGRIYLMDGVNQGKIPLSPAIVGHFDSCLGCLACVTTCPSGVRYDKLIES